MTFQKPKAKQPAPSLDISGKEKREDAKKAIERMDDNLAKALGLHITYYYYILSITAACIGFIISLTIHQKFQPTDCFIMVSLLFWIVSFFLGLRKVNRVNSLIFNFSNYLLGLRNNYEEMITPHKQKVDELKSDIDKHKKSPLIYLAVGLLFFLIWYIIKIMAN